jgi:hypothetical protein
MKPILLTIIIWCGLLVSCYKPYDANVEAEEKILVVEGMITNEVASYSIRLTYALPFNAGDDFDPVISAHVYVSDNLNNSYPFIESGSGYYRSNSLQFTGIPGRTYTLYIETPDNNSYMSDSQRLIQAFKPDTVYAEVDTQETLSRFNELITVKLGGNIMVDIKSPSDTLPQFRFTSRLIKLYYYALCIPPPYIDPPEYFFYCWQTDNINPDINLGYKEYSPNSSGLLKHTVYFVDDRIYVEGWTYGLGQQQPDLSYEAKASANRQSYPISRRILYLNQYSLNRETYLYYKSMDELLRSEGKLFDPIAVQLIGNINCTTNPDKKTFGFFEASSVSRTSYVIGFRQPWNDVYPITEIPYNPTPEPDGCLINKVPPFWVSY